MMILFTSMIEGGTNQTIKQNSGIKLYNWNNDHLAWYLYIKDSNEWASWQQKTLLVQYIYFYY